MKIHKIHISFSQITNFKNDWADGIAYCALIHSFERGKELIGDFDSLKSSEAEKNLELAFSAAEKLGAPRLLDVEVSLFLLFFDFHFAFILFVSKF